ELSQYCFPRALTGPFVLALGSRDPRKNTAGILRAYASVKSRLPAGEKLVIVGLPQWRSSEMFDLAVKLGIDEKVWFAGYVSVENLNWLYSHAVCFLFPSYYEGFGFPVIEAMACGTPVIGSTATCVPEIADNAAILV